jgi:transposase
LLEAYAASDLTQRAFAKREGINFHTFIGWLQRQRGSGGAAAPAMRFQKVRVTTAPQSVAPLEVVLPGGLIVRGQEIAAVAELVQALRS